MCACIATPSLPVYPACRTVPTSGGHTTTLAVATVAIASEVGLSIRSAAASHVVVSSMHRIRCVSECGVRGSGRCSEVRDWAVPALASAVIAWLPLPAVLRSACRSGHAGQRGHSWTVWGGTDNAECGITRVQHPAKWGRSDRASKRTVTVCRVPCAVRCVLPGAPWDTSGQRSTAY